MNYRIDCLQYANWSEKIFLEMREGSVDAVHVTIAYHENFRETVANFEQWNSWFERYPHLIIKGLNASDIELAKQSNRTAIFFGFQNASPIEDDIRLVEILHTLGARFMQLTYNNQSLLGTGCYEPNDSGITRMGKEVIAEMNRVGLVVDMSHSAQQSTLEAIDISQRPIVISHANPSFWHSALRNKSNEVLKALSESGGMLGLSLYPHHLHQGSNCTLESFCNMVADTVELMGIGNVGIGSDLCQGHPDSVVEWMRNGRWTKTLDYGEGSASMAGFPDMPHWFTGNKDFGNIEQGLLNKGFSAQEASAIMGDNWYRFFANNFAAL